MDNYIGKRLDGRYEIQEVIGVGGMAVVYKAYDNIDDRIVAVKILKEEYLASEEFRRRFKNESKAIAVLSHPNIVKVYDVSYGDKLQYIVMEYVEGITLKEYIEQQGVIPWRETVHFTTQILRALQHAHDKGIVHRDIKPQNIMLLFEVIGKSDFHFTRLLVWDKRNKICGRYYMAQTEFIFMLRKGRDRQINDCGYSDLLSVPNIKTKGRDGNIHDSEKPVDLMCVLIGNSSNRGDLVLDPFMGSGTTAEACVRLKRDYIGWEIDAKYHAYCENRLKNLIIQNNLFG